MNYYYIINLISSFHMFLILHVRSELGWHNLVGPEILCGGHWPSLE